MKQSFQSTSAARMKFRHLTRTYSTNHSDFLNFETHKLFFSKQVVPTGTRVVKYFINIAHIDEQSTRRGV